MHDHPEPPAPAAGADEATWRAYADTLLEQLARAERARAASRKAANRRSTLLNRIERDLRAGDVARALGRLEARERYVQEARR